MFIIQLAGIRIRVENRYPYVQKLCEKYLCQGDEYAFSVSATEEEITEEMADGEFPAPYCEGICVYRHITEKMPDFNTFLMHSSIIEVDGNAYAFAAKSGVGKSTHTALWLKNIPHAKVLNGDKPLIHMDEDGTAIAYGTPWNGKENWGENTSAPLRAVCFIERGKVNTIEKIPQSEAISRICHQLYLRGERDSVVKQLSLMNDLLKAVPFYLLHCNISDEAALVAYNAMKYTSTNNESEEK